MSTFSETEHSITKNTDHKGEHTSNPLSQGQRDYRKQFQMAKLIQEE